MKRSLLSGLLLACVLATPALAALNEGDKAPEFSAQASLAGKSFNLAVADVPAGRKDTRGEDIDHGRVDRVTFVVKPDGQIAATIGGVAPLSHAAAR